MLVTLSTTMPSATDLGFLVHKHPDRAQSFDVAAGTAHVVWPEATAERSTVAVILEVDPIALVRARGIAWSASQPFGQRLVNSMFTLSTMVGSSVAQLTQGTIVANLGFTDVTFPHPLYHGDTLYSETEVTAKRLSSSRPGQGIVTFAHTAKNQDGTVVATATRSVLVWREDSAR